LAKSEDELAKNQSKPEVSEEKKAKKPAPSKDETKKAADKPAEKSADKPVAVKAETSDKTKSDEKPASKRKLPSVKLPSFSVSNPAEMKSTAIKVAAVIVALVAVVVIVFGVLVYVYKSDSQVVKAVAAVVPYPVERVNGRFVSYSDYLFEVDANQRAYQNNAKLNNQPAVDFKSKDGKKLLTQIKQHAIEKLESDALVAQLASQKKVKVTDKEVNDLVSQLYQRYGGKDTLLKTLKEIYGWDLNDLKKVVRKQLLAKNLQDKVTSDPKVDATAKAKAQDVLKQIKDGGDFTDIAKKNSQASDAANGGDLGFFTKGQLPDNLQAAAEALQPDQVSDVVKTQYGYEIIKVLEKKDDGSIHAQHILIKTLDFNDYFQAELKKAKLNTYIKV
jgi:foldase protein PrsA